jgi:hypothetical protein
MTIMQIDKAHSAKMHMTIMQIHKTHSAKNAHDHYANPQDHSANPHEHNVIPDEDHCVMGHAGCRPLCKSTPNPLLHNLGTGIYACFKACSEIQLIKI